jgi:hypothetical protein
LTLTSNRMEGHEQHGLQESLRRYTGSASTIVALSEQFIL